MDTEYNLLPDPKEELSEEIKTEFNNKQINLDALFVNGDPFAEVSEDIDPDTVHL